MTAILWAVLQPPIAIKPRYPNGKPHPITLQYDIDPAQWQQWVGVKCEAQLIAKVWNDRIQAIEVTLPAHIPSQNPQPHITVSLQAGVRPVESNEMLATSHRVNLLSGTVPVRLEMRLTSALGRPDGGV